MVLSEPGSKRFVMHLEQKFTNIRLDTLDGYWIPIVNWYKSMTGTSEKVQR